MMKRTRLSKLYLTYDLELDLTTMLVHKFKSGLKPCIPYNKEGLFLISTEMWCVPFATA